MQTQFLQQSCFTGWATHGVCYVFILTQKGLLHTFRLSSFLTSAQILLSPLEHFIKDIRSAAKRDASQITKLLQDTTAYNRTLRIVHAPLQREMQALTFSVNTDIFQNIFISRLIIQFGTC